MSQSEKGQERNPEEVIQASLRVVRKTQLLKGIKPDTINIPEEVIDIDTQGRTMGQIAEESDEDVWAIRNYKRLEGSAQLDGTTVPIYSDDLSTMIYINRPGDDVLSWARGIPEDIADEDVVINTDLLNQRLHPDVVYRKTSELIRDSLEALKSVPEFLEELRKKGMSLDDIPQYKVMEIGEAYKADRARHKRGIKLDKEIEASFLKGPYRFSMKYREHSADWAGTTEGTYRLNLARINLESGKRELINLYLNPNSDRDGIDVREQMLYSVFEKQDVNYLSLDLVDTRFGQYAGRFQEPTTSYLNSDNSIKSIREVLASLNIN